jgi:ketosteroid isomerase-like protein
MTPTLPQPIAAYFAATNTHDIDAMLEPFADDAIVRDEGRERRGLAAIREWIEETIGKYNYQVAVTDLTEANDQPVVTGRVSGTFPGSPLDLRHFFTLADQRITRLEIRP